MFMTTFLRQTFCKFMTQTGTGTLLWPPTRLLMASHLWSCRAHSFQSPLSCPYLPLLWGFTGYFVTWAIPLADMNHYHMSSTWCACTVSCELNKERTGRILALFLWERDVPGGRRFGFWLDGSLARALRGCDPLSLAEPRAQTICCSPGYCWAGLWSNASNVTASGEYHAKKKIK